MIAIAYAMRVRTLSRRGASPPWWRLLLFALGIVLLLAAVVSPIDYYGEERPQAFHMAQHILIGDLAPLALLGGLTRPILRPVRAKS